MNARPAVLYAVEPSLDALEFQRILVDAGHVARLGEMLKHAECHGCPAPDWHKRES